MSGLTACIISIASFVLVIGGILAWLVWRSVTIKGYEEKLLDAKEYADRLLEIARQCSQAESILEEELAVIPRSCRTCAYLSSSGDAYYCKKHNSGGVRAGAILTLEGCDDWELIRTGPPRQVKPKESKDGN